jgi:hypothetical protein
VQGVAGLAGANMLLSQLATLDFESLNIDQRYAEIEKLAAVLIPREHLSEIKRSMFLDKEFRDDFERLSEGVYRSYDRKFLIREFARFAMREECQFAECGVYKGASAYLLAMELGNAGSSKKLHLYDLFEGLSLPASIDGGHWTKLDMLGRVDEVQNNLREMVTHTIYHKGWIAEGSDKNAQDVFAFVHIDVDLHQPTLDSLAYFYPRMSRHGLILCDDYGFETCPGARKAFDDFFKATGDVVLHLPTGQGMVSRRLAATVRCDGPSILAPMTFPSEAARGKQWELTPHSIPYSPNWRNARSFPAWFAHWASWNSAAAAIQVRISRDWAFRRCRP